MGKKLFTIQGWYCKDGASPNVVRVNGKKLKKNSWSPGGFSWGYIGGGPTSLAQAILSTCIPKTKRKAKNFESLVKKFTAEKISKLKMESGFTTWINVKNWLRKNGYQGEFIGWMRFQGQEATPLPFFYFLKT
jgi:hypothetical protein